MGSELHICGDVGAGSAIKLINNALVASINAASIEALIAGRKANLDLETIFSVLKINHGVEQRARDRAAEKSAAARFQAGLHDKLQHKDVGLALKMADDMGIAMRQGRAAYEILDRALETGFGSRRRVRARCCASAKRRAACCLLWSRSGPRSGGT